jgi:flagellar biosynthesis/type III secretory pathway protein FliH
MYTACYSNSFSESSQEGMGKGSLGARTMMQMLHSAYNLQESMEYSEFQLVMEEAKQWVEQKRNDNLPPH